ncbi:hypothetical protein ACJX0J_008464, partial [Zea mays]
FKYNSGQLAPETITDQIYGNTLSIFEIKTADISDNVLPSVGVVSYGEFTIEVIDHVLDYLELMECMVGDIGDKFFTKRALRGVHVVICLTDDGLFSELIDFKGVGCNAPIISCCSYRNSGGLHAIMNSKLKKLANKDEEVVVASGIPCTTIRTSSLQSPPSGERGFNFTEGRKRKEDVAAVCVEALNSIPQKTLIFRG